MKHGTYAEYQRHLRRGESPCEPCRAAAALYQRRRRQQNPDAVASNEVCPCACHDEDAKR